MPAARRSSRTSTSPSIPTPRSACSGRTARASRRCSRIMAGIDKEFAGEAWLAEGATVGYLPQEPQLDPTKDVHRQRHGGRRREEGDPRPLQRTDDELLRRDGGRGDQAPGPDRQPEPLGPRQPGRAGDGRARLPAGRRRRRPTLSGGEKRRVALCQLLLAPARPPAPRRADQPSRRRDACAGWRSTSANIPARS